MTGGTVDSHLHLWSLGSGGYEWLTPAHGALYADFTAERASAELSRAGVSRAVLVQADDTDADTDAMLAAADAHPWIAGVVGWVRLDDPAQAEAQLERRLAHPAFRGVRHLVHIDPRPDFLERPSVRRSLAMLASAGLTFDVPDAWPRHLDQTAALARSLPGLTVVIDHLAKPPRGREDLGAWREQLTRAAQAPNTVAKVSGLRMPGAEYSASALAEVWETALDCFGPARLMWGSDWPMTVPDGGYAPTLAVLDELIGTLSPAEQADLRGGTAERVYRLDPARGGEPPLTTG